MRLTFKDLSVEADTRPDIEYLLGKIEELREQTSEAPEARNEGSGRQYKFIIFPKGEFIVQNLAKESGFTPATIYSRLKAMEEAGDAKVVKEIRREGQRGRATQVWQIINFPIQLATSERLSKQEFEIDMDINPE